MLCVPFLFFTTLPIISVLHLPGKSKHDIILGMDEKVYTDLIMNQLTGLKFSAERHLPATHPVNVALEKAISDILTNNTAAAPVAPVLAKPADEDEEAPERVIPAGFADEEEYDEFLDEQIAEAFADVDEENLGGIRDAITDVVGVLPNANGDMVEIGNVQQSAAAADELVAQFEEENGEVEVENSIYITYKRLDDRELTDDHVRTIINHPISASLQHLGNLQFMEIRGGETPSEKLAVFGIVEEGTISLKTLALGATAYRGVHVFPGIGRVSAAGAVNFI